MTEPKFSVEIDPPTTTTFSGQVPPQGPSMLDPQLPQRKALNAALAAAQGEFKPITKDKTVNVKTREGGTYEFSYATLDAILAVCRPVLSKHGLALTQQLEDLGKPAIRTELRHADGGVLGSSFPLPSVPASPQQLGSLLTYLRRYAIVALLGIAAEEDDDAQQAADSTPSEPKTGTKKDPQLTRMFRVAGNLDKKDTPKPVAYKDAPNWTEVLRLHLLQTYSVDSSKDLTAKQKSEVITWLEKLEKDEIPF